jgi:outer membrane protein OmpA-like peptidoglycan-associated protein
MNKKSLTLSFLIFFFVGFVFAQEIDTKMYFKAGEFDLNAQQKEQLKELLYSVDGENFIFEFTGYTDNVGTIKSNKYLSNLRSENVNRFIKKLCLPTNDVNIIGKGEINPYDGPKEKVNDENRRVEIKIRYKETANKNKLLKNREACLRGEFVNESTNVVNVKNQVPPTPIVEVREVIKEVIVEKPAPPKTYTEEIPKEVKEGDKLIFRGINFMPGSAKLIKSSTPILKRLLGMMQDNPTIKINISGHVCCGIPKDKTEQLEVDNLSLDRAKAVTDFLIKNNISQSRITFSGKGFNEPIVKEEKNSYDQEQNRRVEVDILKK